MSISIEPYMAEIERPSKLLREHIHPEYFEMIKEAANSFRKDPEHWDRLMSLEGKEMFRVDHYHLSLPRRKRLIGELPILFEMGSRPLPPKDIEQFMLALADIDVSLNMLSVGMSLNSNIKKALEAASAIHPTGGTNLGIHSHFYFSHRFEMLGAPFFSLDDQLYLELCQTDIGSQIDCAFLQPPAPFIYLELGSKRHENTPLIWHQESHWHHLEGAYISTYSMSVKDAIKSFYQDDEEDDPLWREMMTKENFLWHALENGFITSEGGDITMMDILLTGSPVGKSHLLDDCTATISFAFQEDTSSVQELIDFYISYSSGEMQSRKDAGESEFDKIFKINTSTTLEDEERHFIPDAIKTLAKALLYINSENCIQNQIRERTEYKKSLKRTLNKAKIRKLKRSGASSCDYIKISLPREEAIMLTTVNDGDLPKNTKSTHWRRAHFNTYWTGKGRTEKRIKRIPRKLVNPVKGLVKPKEYKVKV